MKLFLTIWRYALVAAIALCVGMVLQKQFLILNDNSKVSDEELQSTLRAVTKQVERMSAEQNNSEMQDVQKTLETMVEQMDPKSQN